MLFVLPEAPGEFSLPMAPERVEWCLEVLGWSRGELARRLNVSDPVASGWATGKRNMPYRVAVWLETLARVMCTQPAPFFWGDDDGVGAARHVGGSSRQIDAIEVAWTRPRRPGDPPVDPVTELLGPGPRRERYFMETNPGREPGPGHDE